MPQVEFEPTIPVLERVKTVHALYGTATVIGKIHSSLTKSRLTEICQVFAVRKDGYDEINNG
jgi:hypothetical protein